MGQKRRQVTDTVPQWSTSGWRRDDRVIREETTQDNVMTKKWVAIFLSFSAMPITFYRTRRVIKVKGGQTQFDLPMSTWTEPLSLQQHAISIVIVNLILNST